MPFFDRLHAETRQARDDFVSTPVIQEALQQGVSREMYLDFLAEAYHHVRHTCRLLSSAVAHARDRDQRYIEALLEYIVEERGHEAWILDDIAALGGDAEAVRNGAPGLPCRLMVAYVYYAIAQVSPYAMLGMVHVLEGMSAALASAAAGRLKTTLGIADNAGFSYLSSHGALDQEHVAFFRDLVNGIGDPAAETAIVETAKVVYRLYGDMFREIATRHREAQHAA